MISIYTPIHVLEQEYLKDIVSSLCNQTYTDFEWIVCVNGRLKTSYIEQQISNLLTKEINLRIIEGHAFTKNIGALKKRCCDVAKGDILVELDYDDYLSTTALFEINEAFKTPGVNFVYSTAIKFNWPLDSSKEKYFLFSEYYGWKQREVNGEKFNICFPALPQYLRRIEWSPDHVRAMRTAAYLEVGGYNNQLSVGDDHELVCRFFIKYGEKGFKYIDKPLYYYRVYSKSTSAGQRNIDVQKQTDQNMLDYIEPMYMKWSEDNNFLCLDLGGGLDKKEGYKSVDIREDSDYVMDLGKPWNFEDNSVGIIRAYHVMEHIRDRFKVNKEGELELVYNGLIHFMNEAYRVLVPGGLFLIEVPSITGDGAVSDPTHVKFFNLRSFVYYYNEQLARFIRPEYKGRFQLARIQEWQWRNTQTNVITTHLIALKDWYDKQYCGEKLI